MEVALFIPCYIDQFYPAVGRATLELLERLECSVNYPKDQTCCGQPIANSGYDHLALPIYHHMAKTFANYQYIVCPSASCAYHIRHHYTAANQDQQIRDFRNNVYDLTEFLVDVLQVSQLSTSFPYRVGLHQSCHGLRGMRLAKSSELGGQEFSKWKYLLNLVDDLELVELNRSDECCGFGGTFSVKQEQTSVQMGEARITDHLNNGAQYIASGDMSCLMHLEGIIRRQKIDMEVIHIAEILNRQKN